MSFKQRLYNAYFNLVGYNYSTFWTYAPGIVIKVPYSMELNIRMYLYMEHLVGARLKYWEWQLNHKTNEYVIKLHELREKCATIIMLRWY